MIYAYELKERDSTRKPVGAHMPIPDASLWPEASKYLENRGLAASLAYWQARLIDNQDAERPRYTSPAVPRGDSIVVVWPFGSLIKSVVIVEGAMDALAAAGEGAAGVALMGNRPALEAFETICRFFPYERLVIIPDMDSLREVTDWLCALASLGRRAEVILPAPNKDLAAAAPARRALLLRSVH